MSTGHRADEIPGCSLYAHQVVYQVLEHVEHLENIWNTLQSDRKIIDTNDYQNIRELIGYLGRTGAVLDDETAKTIFRYLSSAIIYASLITLSFISDSAWKEHRKSTGLEYGQRIRDSIDLAFIDRISKLIIIEMRHHTDTKDFEDFTGNRAALRSPGSIPFMKVHSSSDHLVCIRRGVELRRSIDSQSRKVDRIDQPLDDFPYRTYLNGAPNNGLLQGKTLSHILPKLLIERTLQGKTITWMHIIMANDVFPKNQYEIDIIDTEITSDRMEKYGGDLMSISGSVRSDWKSELTPFDQYDIIVSFFGDILFSGWIDLTDGTEILSNSSQDLEFWCQSIIEGYTESILATDHSYLKNHIKMYIGFSFEAVLKGGFGDKTTVSGSSRILLLALVKGLVSLLENKCSSNKHVPLSCLNLISENEKPNRFRIQNFFYNMIYSFSIHNVCFDNDIFSEAQVPDRFQNEERLIQNKHDQSYKVAQIVPVNMLGRQENFRSASARFITVRTKIPNMFITFLLLGFSIVMLYAIPNARMQKNKGSDANWIEYYSGLASVISVVIGIIFLFTKCLFRNWDIVDMLHMQRNTYSISDMRQVLIGREQEAIDICCRIENPERVFSKWRSNPFVDWTSHEETDTLGEGEFKIDTTITVGQLEKSGYFFGVDFNGLPIVADCHGKIRKVNFYKPRQSTDDFTSDYKVHIGSTHDLQLKYIFKLPIRDLHIENNPIVE